MAHMTLVGSWDTLQTDHLQLGNRLKPTVEGSESLGFGV